jgi:thymidine phosphorylase
MVDAMGGPCDLAERPDKHLESAPLRRAVTPRAAGVVQSIDARALGMAVVELGGGRRRSDDVVDPAVGLDEIACIGETVDAKRPLAVVHARDDASAERAIQAVRAAFLVGEHRSASLPLIHRRVFAEAGRRE